MIQSLSALVREESAISTVEYALLLAALGIGLFAAMQGLGAQLAANFDQGAQNMRP